jgi:hypothetical protein
MLDRPSRLWKTMSADKRTKAAEAFWRDTEAPEIEAQHAEALTTLARRLNFRTKSLTALSIERRARLLAQLTDVSEPVATRALIAYHFAEQRPLMSAFLDGLGISHDQGLINEEQLAPPPADKLQAVIGEIKKTFDPADVDLYLRTLAALDGETWTHLTDLIQPSA